MMLWERCPAMPLLALQHVSSAMLSVSGRSQVILYSCVPFQPVWFNTAVAQRLQLALAVNDGALSGAALQGLWNLLVPLLRLRRPSAFLLHPLCSIVEALRLLPAERLVAVRRAPQLLACAAFALVRLSQQAVRERVRVRVA